MSNDIIVFTMHKSASMFIHKQCELLSKLSGIAYNSPNLLNSGLNPRRLLTDKNLWHTYHGCFAPIRFFVDVPQLDNYEIILHLRDPRDVLVSMFYSYCYIHNGEIAGDTGYRRETAAKGIDEFVLNMVSERSSDYKGNYGTGRHVEDLIGNLPKRYRDYIDQLLGRPNVILVKYEEMVTDYRSWLEKFVKPFPLDDKGIVIDKLVAQSSTFFPKRTRDVMNHVRHVTPGDHQNKLKPSTIQQLNDIFSDTLDALGYEK
ncbi:MAG: sulfotransferase domain-containing protein [Synechococcus sp.]